jgi:hypothetical protein
MASVIKKDLKKISTILAEDGGDQTSITQTSCLEIVQSQFEGLWFSKLRLVSLVFSKSALLLTTSYLFSCVGSTSFRSNSDSAPPTIIDCWLCCSSLSLPQSANRYWLPLFLSPRRKTVTLFIFISFRLWLLLRAPNFSWLSIQSRLYLTPSHLYPPFRSCPPVRSHST